MMTAFRWHRLLPFLLVGFCHGQGQVLVGRFTTTTDVTSWLNFANDAADMRESNDQNEKKEIYVKGRHANITENGAVTTRSLAGLSLDSYPLMEKDAMYNFYRHAFLVMGNKGEGEALGNFDQKPVEEYANTLVEDLFDLNIAHIETEAALVTCLWMAIVHELYNVLRGCQQQVTDDMNAALDRAAAMWIGADQPMGANDQGNLLYNLAQRAALPFNQANGEATANKLLLDAMLVLQTDIKDGICSTGEGGYLRMRTTVNRIIDVMSIPLLQMLIHHIQNYSAAGAPEFTELYALSIAPRVAVCNPLTYQAFLDLMVYDDIDADVVADAISAVQWSLSCQRLTCDDIGSYESGEVPACNTTQYLPGDSYAGYSSAYNVRQYSMIDRDILQIRILARMKALEAALDYYKHGMNAKLDGSNEDEFLSLQILATAESRSAASDQFGLYTSYFGSNDYADKKINNILTSVSPYDLASDPQRAELVAGYLIYMVMYMAVLEKLNEAVNACENNEESRTFLDQAVAFYIGSMEGPNEGGFLGGQLLYATSKALCGTFSKCVKEDVSELNQKMLEAFDDTSNELLLGNCDEAVSSLKKIIEPLLVVPLIQGVLNSAAVNADLATGSDAASLGTADPFAFAMAPFIDSVDNTLGASLLLNLEFKPDQKPVSGGAADVFDIFRTSLTSLQLECSDVGQHPVYGSVCVDGVPTPTYAPVGSVDSTPTDDAPSSPNATPTTAPAPTPAAAPTAIGFGRYVFSGDSDISMAGLALDVKAMRSATDIAEATSVYSSGVNVRNGETDGTVSLASLSLNAETSMKEDIDYNLFRFALASEQDFSGDGSYLNASTYADEATMKAFEVAADSQLAAEAAVVLNVWMQIASDLQAAVKLCQTGGNGVSAIDKAAAIWLGMSQTEGSDDSGYLAYSIAEKAATRFGAETASESWVNTALFDAFNEAKDIAAECVATRDKYLDLRGLVADIVEALGTPLLQNLIYYMSKAEKSSPDYISMENYVELYALSVVPRLIGCNPSSYFYLQTKLVDEDFDTSKIDDDEFVGHMQTLQKCYDLECVDLRPNEISDANLKATVQKLCYKQQSDPGSIAGYTPATDVSEYLKLDLDMVQIGILAQTEAFDAAIDMYKNGYNSRPRREESNVALSLQSLATSSKRFMVTDQFSQFSNYYGSDSYADDEIMAALQMQGVYETASVDQRREAVMRTFQCTLSYMTILTNLYSAVDECKAGRVTDATAFWDQAAALYVGSIEGEIRGGDPDGYGELLYSLAKEVCDDFGTCETSSDASSNESLLDSFSNGLNLIVKEECDSAQRFIKSEIIPLLPIPLIQGMLFYSTLMEDLPAGTTDANFAAGYVMSRAILPLVNDANSTSADMMEANMNFQLTADPVSDGSPEIFTAITYALPGMNVDCKRIGSFDNLTVCSDDLAAHSSTPTVMADGLYTTTTYVKDRANIALDVKAIKEVLSDGSVDLAKAIYVDGENSDIYNENGIKIGKRTLSGFSTKAPTEMADDPLYTIFRYALQDDQGLFLGKDVGLYADTLVNEAFENTNAASQLLGAEAVVVYNIWMYLAHELFQTLRNCKNKTVTDMDGIHSIDEAVAYWIGDGQVTGDGEQGHLLYALAEQMGERFGLDETGQSRTNTNILGLFNQAKLELSLPTACSDDPETHPRLFHIVNKIVSWMTVPLVQGLIHNLYQNDKDRVKLYGRAVWPLVAGCSNSTFTALKDKLFTADFNVIEVDDIVARIETTYECLGFTCDDIGVHEEQTKHTCTDISVLNPLAGYVPLSDVRAFALIDLDIFQSNILMKMGAYGAVEDLYTNGKHAVVEGENGSQTLSLYKLATTSQRSVVPQFDSFKRFYEDELYADTIIRDALANKDASTEQRREMVVKGMQYLVLYMAAAQEMYLSVADCSSPDAAKILDAEEAWDRAAAYLIGSMEGPEDGGSLEGQSFYALARERCEEFGTCSATGKASWNDELNSVLYTGRGAVESRACGELRKTTTEIETLMLIPLIQSTLRYANANAKLGKGTTDKGLAEGFVFSRAVLPLVEDANTDSAKTIDENMDFQLEKKPVHEGSALVWNAFARAYGRMGVECELVGETESFDACTSATSPSDVQGNDNLAMILGIILGILAALAIGVFLYYFDRKKKQQMLAENRPSFVPPKGEFNHTPDQLTGSTYMAGEPDSDLEDDDYNDTPESPYHDLGPCSSNDSPESPQGGTTLDTSRDSPYTID